MVFGTGPNVGGPLVVHPDVPLISFTGSTVTGRTIAQAAAPFFKKLSLEVDMKTIIDSLNNLGFPLYIWFC